MPGSPNMVFAAQVLRWCVGHGVCEAILCAGARNLALVATFAHADGMRCWNFPEERSAAFFALGRARALGRPVAVIVTSGTAVAELLPAVIEAHYQRVPLLLLTADRPRFSRGSGAPQTILQPGIFGPHAEMLGDTDAAHEMNPARWSMRGPGHLNLCFAEPVLDGPPVTTRAVESAPRHHSPDALAPAPAWDGFGTADGQRLLVMVGALAAAERAPVAAFLTQLEAPVSLEATSGLWGDERLLPLWRRRLKRMPECGPTHVLRLGGVPCDRFWRDLEDLPSIRVRSLSREGWSGLARASETLTADLAGLAVPQAIPAAAWWQDEPELATANRSGAGEMAWFEALAAHIPNTSLVFLGNSLPIREWHAAATWRGGLEVYANRGANGIDGELATFLGLAAEHPGEAWGLFGDLTTLYDLAAPWVLGQCTPRPIRLVVINNGGGRIFAKLPEMQQADPHLRQQVMNLHQLDFRPWADFWKLDYLRCRSPDQLAELPDDKPVIIEIVPTDAR